MTYDTQFIIARDAVQCKVYVHCVWLTNLQALVTVLAMAPAAIQAVVKGKQIIDFKTVMSERKSNRNVLTNKDAPVSQVTSVILSIERGRLKNLVNAQ